MAISVRGVIPKKSSHCSPLQPALTWQFQSWGGGGVFSEKSSHCSPLQPTLTWQFQSGGNSWKLLPLQTIAAHFYMAISVKRGGVILEKSSHCSPILHGNFSEGVIPEKSSHCSQLQPTLTWQFQSGGNSWKVLPLQPIAAHSYLAISVMGVIPEKSSHCSPLLHGNFSQGIIPEIPPIAAHCSPLLHGNFSEGIIPEKSSHCGPLQPTFTWQFQSGGNS